MSQLSPELVELQEAVAGRYSLDRELRRGPAVIQFQARDVALDRPVVLKLLRRERASDPAVRRRFLEVARQAAGLFHPNILPTHAVEEAGDLVFAVTPSVEGETVAERVEKDGRMDPEEVRRMVEEAASALAYAHARGVFHGDLGPHSLILEGRSVRTLVADFGMSHAGGESDAGWRTAPELAETGRPDARSDLYALGATSRYALTGEARSGRRPSSTGGKALKGTPSPLAEVLEQCLTPDPAGRPQSALALARAVSEEGILPATLPPAVHRLLRRIRRFSPVAGIGLLLLWLLRDGALELFLTPVIALVFAVMGVGLFRSAREVLEEGLDAELIEFMLEEEALDLEARGEAPDRGLQNMAIGCGGFVFALGVIPVSLVALATILSLITGGGLIALEFWGDLSIAGVLLVTFLFLAGPSLPKDSPLRSLDLGERMMVGRFGRLLFRLARIGLRGADRALPGSGSVGIGQPTEVLVSAQAEELFRSLPREVRDRFGEVPEALQELRDHVASLRKKDEDLADAIRRLGDSPGEGEEENARVRRDLEAARARVKERIGEAVAALEHLRLNMLYLGAGSGTEEDLTVDLRRARELSDELDDLAEGRDEVSRILGPEGGGSFEP